MIERPRVIEKRKRGSTRAAEQTSRGATPRAAEQINDSSSAETQTCALDMENATKVQEAYVKMNKNGVLVEGGEIFNIEHSGQSVIMGVKKVMADSTAVGNLIIGNSVMEDVTMTAPINRLSTAKPSAINRRDRKVLDDFSIFQRRNNLVVAPFEVRLGVRKALLGKALLKEVQSALRLSSYKKSFSLGVLSPEFDFDIFHIDGAKAEFSYILGNLSCLDSLMGESWDLQSPAGRCNFVTKVTLKVKDLQLFGKVYCARCRQPLPKNYRTFLSRYDISQVETEAEVEDEARE